MSVTIAILGLDIMYCVFFKASGRFWNNHLDLESIMLDEFTRTILSKRTHLELPKYERHYKILLNN